MSKLLRTDIKIKTTSATNAQKQLLLIGIPLNIYNISLMPDSVTVQDVKELETRIVL